MIQIEPCKFCGHADPEINLEHGKAWVSCPACEACGPTAIGDETAAMILWNSATPAPSPSREGWQEAYDAWPTEPGPVKRTGSSVWPTIFQAGWDAALSALRPAGDEGLRVLEAPANEMFRWLNRLKMDPYTQSAVNDFRKALEAALNAKTKEGL